MNFLLLLRNSFFLFCNIFCFCFYLKLYQSIFETEFIRESELLYKIEGEAKLQLLEVPDYLNHVEKRFGEENNRLLHYLHSSSKQPLIFCLEKYLIGEHIQSILQKGFDQMISEHRLGDLKLLYLLISRISNGVDQLRVAYSQYIKVRFYC